VNSESNEIAIGNIFTLANKNHAGKFIIYDSNQYWHGQINALHKSDALSGNLLGKKLKEFVVLNLGLGIHDEYEIVKISSPVEYGVTEISVNIDSRNEGGAVLRWRDAARDGIVLRNVPELTLSDLYQEYLSGRRPLQMISLSPPSKKGDLSKKNVSSLDNSLFRVDIDEATVVIKMETLQREINLAIKDHNFYHISKLLKKFESDFGFLNPEHRFASLPRYKRLHRSVVEARVLLANKVD